VVQLWNEVKVDKICQGCKNLAIMQILTTFFNFWIKIFVMIDI